MDSVVRVEGADCLETFLSEHLKVSGRVYSPERGFPLKVGCSWGSYRFLFGILLQERIRTKKTEQKVELKRISTNLLSLNCLKIVVMHSGFQLFSPSLWSTWKHHCFDCVPLTDYYTTHKHTMSIVDREHVQHLQIWLRNFDNSKPRHEVIWWITWEEKFRTDFWTSWFSIFSKILIFTGDSDELLALEAQL